MHTSMGLLMQHLDRERGMPSCPYRTMQSQAQLQPIQPVSFKPSQSALS